MSQAAKPWEPVAETPLRILRWVLAGMLLGASICFVVSTWRWMLLCDSPIMHYVNFLMQHGMKPYREIMDNNLPGAYLSEGWAMRVFGGGDVGWRVYEFFLLAAMMGAMVVIARPYDWVAGVFGGGMFLLVHGLDGPWSAVERDEVMTVLLVVGYAALFNAVRRRAAGWMLAAGFLTAFAASIKPTVAPLGVVLLGMAAWELRRQGVAWVRYVAVGLVGMAVAAGLSVGFLLWHHAWGDFLFTQRVITPYYVALAHLPVSDMIIRLLPAFAWVLFLGGLVLALSQRRWTWEQWALGAGALMGAVSYFQQHKGFIHHRYLFLAFMLLLAGLEMMRALRRQDWRGWWSAGLVVLTITGFIPRAVWSIDRAKGTSDLTLALEADLTRLGGTTGLQRQVQCLDLTFGCLNSLYHLGLVENTGFTGDMVIFDPQDGAARRLHREMWWRLAQADPANVLVVTDQYFQGQNSFAKVANWPEFKAYLDANYTLRVERMFPNELGSRVPDPAGVHGYRIYVGRGSPLEAIPLN